MKLLHNPFSKIAIQFFLSLLFASLLFSSCRRNEDLLLDKRAESREEIFFKLSKPVSKEVEKIIEKLKLENARNGFVNNLNDKEGLPVWDKIEVIRRNNYLGRGLSDSTDSTETIIIPLTVTEKALSSVLIAEETANSTFDFKNYTSNDYLYKKAHEANVDEVKMMEFFTLFFYMENKTFGAKVFYNIPDKYFDNSELVDYKGDKIIQIQDIDYTTANYTTICITYVCSVCLGDDPNCPLGGRWTVCTTVGGDYGGPIGQGWDPNNVTNGEPFGGSGGGGGTTPTTTLPPCPGTIWYELWREAEVG